MIYHALTCCYSVFNVTVRPQHIAVLASNNITSDSDGRPVLTFYAQLDNERVLSSDVLTRAVEVRMHARIEV